ncbi:MAG: MBL fold metallo-hydrolase [Gammaproteobacteria bacterium]|nr:MBL fold metallo-hydrolase [Gammaproteobacteria bacterium]
MKNTKVTTYKIGRVWIPDYVPGVIAVVVLIIGFPFIVESQQSAEISTEAVGDGRYVLFGRGGNILASIGEQGVLIVDSQFPDMVPKYQSTIRSLGGGDIDFTINTHWHYDHADGNEMLGEAGSWIIAHAHSRDMMTKHNTINTVVNPLVEQPPYSQAGLPVATFEQRMEVFFNGEQIDLIHPGPAHTMGDAAIFLRDSNIVHMGDVFNNAGYPFIDADNGGDIEGMIAFCEAVLGEINSNTVVVPGHGPVATYNDLAEYITMLTEIRGKMMILIGQGASLEEVIAAKPTENWDAEKGDPLRLIDRAYLSLTR